MKRVDTPSELVQLPFLTTEQVATLLQCSVEHVRRQVRLGKVPGVEVHLGVVRIRTTELLSAGGVR
jgi:excisionase family DNA binding protein